MVESHPRLSLRSRVWTPRKSRGGMPRYNQLDQEKVTARFADQTTHTIWSGAELTAEIAASGLRALAPAAK